MADKRSEIVSASITSDEKKLLEKWAEEDERKLSWIVWKAIQEYIKKREG